MASAGGSNQAANAYDPANKKHAITIVNTIVEAILRTSKADLKSNYNNLDFSHHLEGAVSTVYNTMRKEDNKSFHQDPAVMDRVANIWSTNTCKIGDVINEVKKDLQHGNINYMVTTPIVNMHTVNKVVKDEVRIGVTQLIPKKGNKDKPVSISSYGLRAVHAPYLKYVTVQPERRSGLMMCVGPLALAINLLEDKQYQEKTKNALKEQLKHLPMKDAIVECLSANTKSTIGGLLPALGDLLLLVTDRSHQKMTPPLSKVIERYTLQAMNSQVEAFSPDHYTDEFDFSGKGATVFYREALAGKKLKWVSDEPVTTYSSQVFFHSTFSTHLEDLGVLEKITDVPSWNSRKDLSKVFTRKGSKTVEFIAPTMKYSSKLANACGTKMLGTVEPMVMAKPVFSGKRKRSFSDDFVRSISRSSTGAYSTDVASVTKALVDLKEKVLSDPLDVNYGTVDWYDVPNVTVTDWGQPSTFVVEETNKYFYA